MFRDDYFHLRVDTSVMEELEAGNHQGHRWWTDPDLATTSERVVPLRLAPLLIDLVAGRLPVEPVRLPWHHEHRPLGLGHVS